MEDSLRFCILQRSVLWKHEHFCIRCLDRPDGSIRVAVLLSTASESEAIDFANGPQPYFEMEPSDSYWCLRTIIPMQDQAYLCQGHGDFELKTDEITTLNTLFHRHLLYGGRTLTNDENYPLMDFDLKRTGNLVVISRNNLWTAYVYAAHARVPNKWLNLNIWIKGNQAVFDTDMFTLISYMR